MRGYCRSMAPSLFSFGRARHSAGHAAGDRVGSAEGRASGVGRGKRLPGTIVPQHAPTPEPPAPASPTDLDDASRARVDAALASWREELVGLGGVASLDDVSLLDGAVDLTAAHPSGLAQLYAGRPTPLSSLIREPTALAAARKSVRKVAGRTDILARQFGVAPVYLAIGVATWTETIRDESRRPGAAAADGAGSPESDGPGGPGDSDAGSDPEQPHHEIPDPVLTSVLESALSSRPAGPPGTVRTVNAPVLMRPVRLASASADATIAVDPTIEVNPVLTRALRRYGSTADIQSLARAALTAEGFTPRAALTRIAAACRDYLPGFELRERLVVGAFVHPGQALVEDFDAVVDRARLSAIVAALAGVEPAQRALAVDLPAPWREDRAPDAERGAGDLDPGQLDVVESVGLGASLLLDAPPGSDVAATLAAVLADAAATGRTAIHIPATSGDGHAVAQALEDLGLGDLVVDLTEDASWRRHAAEAVQSGLGSQPPQLDVPEILRVRQRLTAVRKRLSRYVTALHTRREPWNVSAYEALQTLAELTSSRSKARTTAKIVPGRLERLDDAGRERASRILHRAHSLGMLNPVQAPSPWSGLALTDLDEVTDALGRLGRLADDMLPAVETHSREVSSYTGLRRATTLAMWSDQLDMLDGVRDSLDVFLPEVFERSAADLVIATATKRWREERSIVMSGSARRRFTRQAKDLVRPGRVVEDLHAELVKVQRRREEWRRHDPDGGWPTLPQGLDEMRRTCERAMNALTELQPLLDRHDGSPALVDTPLVDLTTRVRALADDPETAQAQPERNQTTIAIDEMGMGPLVEDLRARQVPDDELDDELTYCWWSSVLAQALREDPDMGGLDAKALDELSESLRRLDAAQSASLSGPVAQACARRVRAAVEADKQQARSLYIALSKDDGVPLRDILDAHPVAWLARPVWIVPPTLVPQVLAPSAVVDLAILDASASMPVAQALPALVRAEQVLVIGDPRRADRGLAAELGPLLPAVTLPTGRNQLDAGIASFLASNGYEGIVEVIPGPPGDTTLSLIRVDGRGMPAPGRTAVETVPAEVDQVVDVVIEHALTRPDESLGVIALNTRHADEIRRAVAVAAAESPALDDFFSSAVKEPFTVIDLREARSLRRDRVVLSVGFAKTPHGRTIHAFGELGEQGGMVSLVEALCASRGATTVISSIGAEDLDPDRLRAPGARLLREVLARAAGGGTPVGPAENGEPDRLLVDLAWHLWRKGLVVVPQWGADGGSRIPLAIGHPDYPEELFVAVLTDDDDYVAEPSLRRRDRHWVERLESRGWRVHRSFSAGVFVDPEAEARTIEIMIDEILDERSAAQARPEGPELPEHVDDAAAEGAAESTASPQGAAAARATEGARPDEDGREASAGAESSSPGAGAPGAPVNPPRADGRAARPPIAQGLPIQAYSDDELDDLVAWIRSDGVARSEEEELTELRETLALTRRGTGVDAVLGNAVRRGR